MSIDSTDAGPASSSCDMRSAEGAVSEPRTARKPHRLLFLAVLAAAGTAAWVSFVASKSLDSRDLVFVPDDATVLVHVEATHLMQSKLCSELKEFFETLATKRAPNGSVEILKQLGEGLETITFGIKASPSVTDNQNNAMAGVLRSSQPLLMQEVIQDLGSSRSAEEEIDGKSMQIYGKAAFCQIDERTIAFGDPPSLREVLRRGREEATLLDDMQDALGKADFSQLLTVVAAGSLPSSQALKQVVDCQLPNVIVANADVAEDIDLTACLVMQSESDVEALKSKVQPFLEMAKKRSAEAAEALETLEFSTSGKTLTVSLTIPGPPLVELAKAQAEKASRINPAFAKCQQNLAELDSAIERYHSDKGEFPADLDQLGTILPANFPRFCEAHGFDFVIHPDQHRAVHGMPSSTVISNNAANAAIDAQAE